MGEQLRGTVVPTSRLGSDQCDRLYGLFERYYRRIDRPTFDRDLEEKDQVILLLDSMDRIRGFTTAELRDVAVLDRRVRSLFSGNTIVEKRFWGQQELVRTWTRLMAETKAAEPSVPLYWHLICSGYRTYLYLPIFYREFYPRHDRPTPALEGELLETLNRSRFPTEYRDGIVRVAEPREVLLEGLAEPSPHKLSNPHVRYFVETNSGYRHGDELVCLAEFAVENLRGFPRRIAQKVLGESCRIEVAS